MPRTSGFRSETQAIATLSLGPATALVRREEPKPSLIDAHAPEGSSTLVTRCSPPSSNDRYATPKCLPALVSPPSSCATRNFPEIASGLYIFPLGVVQSCAPDSNLIAVIAPSGFEK